MMRKLQEMADSEGEREDERREEKGNEEPEKAENRL